MSLCCPICEGDEKFCKEHGCGRDPIKVANQVKPQLLVSKKVFEDLLDATDEKGNVDKKPKKVLCARCNNPIHIDDFGGISKKGSFHGACIIFEELTK